jgi:general stress protein 26
MSEAKDARPKVYELLKSFSTAMFVTLGQDGLPVARPMHVAQIEEGTGDICFFTGVDGTLHDQVAEENRVLLLFQKDNSAFLSVRGTTRIEQDRTRIKELWKEIYKVWFLAGPEDPDVALLIVNPVEAEYWDNRGTNKVKYLFDAVTAYVTGETPDRVDPDLHAKTEL